MEDEREPGSSAEQGRRYVLLAIGLLVASDVAVTALFVARVGTERLPQQIVRLVLLLGLGYALMRRRRWARWVTFALMLAALWVIAPHVLSAGAFARDRLAATLPLLVLWVVYGLVARGLIYSESVRAYFAPPPDAR